jgi:hypothetical protein
LDRARPRGYDPRQLQGEALAETTAPKKTVATPQVVAEWMMAELDQSGRLYRARVADDVAAQHGPPLVAFDEDGLPILQPPVIAAFQELTGEAVVWCMSGQYWRRRRPGDRAGREQRG